MPNSNIRLLYKPQQENDSYFQFQANKIQLYNQQKIVWQAQTQIAINSYVLTGQDIFISCQNMVLKLFETSIIDVCEIPYFKSDNNSKIFSMNNRLHVVSRQYAHHMYISVYSLDNNVFKLEKHVFGKFIVCQFLDLVYLVYSDKICQLNDAYCTQTVCQLENLDYNSQCGGYIILQKENMYWIFNMVTQLLTSVGNSKEIQCINDNVELGSFCLQLSSKLIQNLKLVEQQQQIEYYQCKSKQLVPASIQFLLKKLNMVQSSLTVPGQPLQCVRYPQMMHLIRIRPDLDVFMQLSDNHLCVFDSSRVILRSYPLKFEFYESYLSRQAYNKYDKCIFQPHWYSCVYFKQKYYFMFFSEVWCLDDLKVFRVVESQIRESFFQSLFTLNDNLYYFEELSSTYLTIKNVHSDEVHKISVSGESVQIIQYLENVFVIVSGEVKTTFSILNLEFQLEAVASSIPGYVTFKQNGVVIINSEKLQKTALFCCYTKEIYELQENYLQFTMKNVQTQINLFENGLQINNHILEGAIGAENARKMNEQIQNGGRNDCAWIKRIGAEVLSTEQLILSAHRENTFKHKKQVQRITQCSIYVRKQIQTAQMNMMEVNSQFNRISAQYMAHVEEINKDNNTQ
ncbi:Hypothetical_protein [Hexamita inflata]|uniref:Hypothetical_protein n=1 Tax=Hexamita inflata TaxID=28002 RepID=A0AA86Q4U6_9EUKA|nr:Hypothetical protein HINF_LOCUS33742 [Hexamita inflata]